MTQRLYGEAFNIESVDSGDLQTSPAVDGSDFTELQIIDVEPGCTQLDIDIFAMPVSSFNFVIRLYRWEPAFEAYCKSETTFTLETPITDTVNGEYRALESIDIGNHKIALALEDGETGARFRLAWRRSVGSR